uniref:3-beta hydroxysteroid dehydrogenase/isomerase domain-containing protein n=1 Tax=Amblyomma maculatum TaxID=34609 RepID=G3MLN4_AMBMU
MISFRKCTNEAKSGGGRVPRRTLRRLNRPLPRGICQQFPRLSGAKSTRYRRRVELLTSYPAPMRPLRCTASSAGASYLRRGQQHCDCLHGVSRQWVSSRAGSSRFVLSCLASCTLHTFFFTHVANFICKGHLMLKKTRQVVASVCDAKALKEAVRGANAVIHCAALVPTTVMEDEDAFERINVKGTQNVVDACLEENVQYLVCTGSAGVIKDEGSQDGKFHHEGPYSESKAKAERIICEASGCVLRDGVHRLRTFVARLLPLYGELDHAFIGSYIKWSRKTFNTLFRLGPGFQCIYAGNAAAFHVRALDALCEDATLSGRCLVACDDTPLDGIDFLRPLVEGHGIRIYRRPVPYRVMMAAAQCTLGVVRVIAPVFPSVRKLVLPKPSDVRYIYKGAMLDDGEAREILAWLPRYSLEETVRLSRSFYDKL